MNDPLSTFGFIAAIRNTTSTASTPVPHTSNVFGHPLPPTRWCSTSQPAIDVPTPRSNRAGISARYTSRTIEFRLVNFPASIKSALHDFIRPRWPRAYRQGEAYTITLDVRFRDTCSWHLFRARMEDYVRLQQEVVAWLLDRGWVFEHTMAARSSLPVISVQSSKFHKSGGFSSEDAYLSYGEVGWIGVLTWCRCPVPGVCSAACGTGAVQVAQHIDACAWRVVGSGGVARRVLYGLGRSLWIDYQAGERIGAGGAEDRILVR